VVGRAAAPERGVGHTVKDYPFHERTVGRLLEDKARTIGDKVYFRHDGLAGTYRDIDADANRVANALLDVGLRKGDRVCLMLGNSVEFLHAWFGAAKIGAVIVPINTALKGPLLQYIINNSDSTVIVIDADLVDRLAFIREGIANVRTLIVVGKTGDMRHALGSGRTVRTFADCYAASAAAPTIDVGFFDPMSILYTSGTTGPSKGAVLSHAHYYLTARNANAYLAYDDSSVLYSCLPLFHANASILSALGAVLAEATFALGTRFSLTTFWDEIRAYQATHTNVLGSIFSLLWRQPPRADDSRNPLRVMNAGPLIPEVDAFARRFGVQIATGFGTTETGIVCATGVGVAIPTGSCGKPLGSYEVRIVDDHDLEGGAEQPGEIVVRGREPYAQMDGYFNMPEATVRAFRNCWYHTGDLGRRDADGHLYFVDRKKDAIRRRGENISSFEVEAVIAAHPSVAECAVFAVASELGEDDVKAVVVTKPGTTLSPEMLIGFCEDRLAYFAVPRYVEFADALPRTPTLRVEKYKLKERGNGGETWDRERAGYKLKR
jgi:carnitine-CoA ligase